jgi:hypothetical protein
VSPAGSGASAAPVAECLDSLVTQALQAGRQAFQVNQACLAGRRGLVACPAFRAECLECLAELLAFLAGCPAFRAVIRVFPGSPVFGRSHN